MLLSRADTVALQALHMCVYVAHNSDEDNEDSEDNEDGGEDTENM